MDVCTVHESHHGGPGCRACVVCTGRVMDFIESGKLATDAVKFLVLDEADRLLDSGSQELVMKLFSKLPKANTGTQRLQVTPFMQFCLT